MVNANMTVLLLNLYTEVGTHAFLRFPVRGREANKRVRGHEER
jgi:hypothetical protein